LQRQDSGQPRGKRVAAAGPEQPIWWAETWGIKFNVIKCQVMHLGHNNPGHTYTMSNQQLTATEEERDIGVCIKNP
jgi:hypothetical protein